MVIGIDIDDTIVDTRKLQEIYWKEYVNMCPNPMYTFEVPANINQFGDPYINVFWNLYRDKMFFSDVKQGVSETIFKLKQDGNIICFITARPEIKYINLINRLKEELEKNNIYYDYIITGIKNKALYIYEHDIDLLIDDDIIKIEQTKIYNKPSILFNEVEEYDGYQTTNWFNIYEIVNNIRECEYEKKSKENIKIYKR